MGAGGEVNTDIEKYTYMVDWSAEDREFVGLCVEFPSLSWLDENLHQALTGIQRVVRECVQDMRENGEYIPPPFCERAESGVAALRPRLWVASAAVENMTREMIQG